MPTLEELRGQLDDLEDLRSIVSTMKALSAASIRQYERAVAALADYYRTVELGLHVVLRNLESPQRASRRRRERAHLAAIIFGSDHGLCGRFNEDIAVHAVQRMSSAPAEPERRLILAVGARASASLQQHGQRIEQELFLPGSASRITGTVERILLQIDAWQNDPGLRWVYLFHNRPTAGSAYRPSGTELLPLDLRRFRRLEEEKWPSRSLPTFTMDRGRLLAKLLRQYLFVSIFKACAESQATEHASRLAAMQSAERNLSDHIEEVTNRFRRARQTSITSELLDVVSGFEAIAGETGDTGAL